MWVIWLIIVGAAAGFIASKILGKDLDLVTTMVIGIAGALIGGILLRIAAIGMGLLGGLVGAVVGALLVLWVWQQIKRR